MTEASKLHTLKAMARSVPGVRQLREQLYEKRFSSMFGAFRGVFATFAEAIASAPPARPVGFDNTSFASEYRDRMGRIYDYDYPVLFWLKSRALETARRVFDLGGHVGVQYYAYEKYLEYPEGLEWQVCEVPAVVTQGRALAIEKNRPQLSFTSRFEDGDGAYTLISAGTLQYIETPGLAQILSAYTHKPKHLLLNKLPLTNGAAFVTLQNVGSSFVPQHVFNRGAFIAGLEAVGYRLTDQWSDRVHSCHVPFWPERSVHQYSGLYFEKS